VAQTTIIILADKSDPHLSAAKVSFAERSAAASDEWTCLPAQYDAGWRAVQQWATGNNWQSKTTLLMSSFG